MFATTNQIHSPHVNLLHKPHYLPFSYSLKLENLSLLKMGTQCEDRERVPGVIEEIRLKNFMTYQDCTLEPGKEFNVILGPNGSGKSSIVTAIVIGTRLTVWGAGTVVCLLSGFPERWLRLSWKTN